MLATICILKPQLALADYVAIGQITSTSCKTYIFIGSCEPVTVDAIDVSGKLYEPRRRYEHVTTYDEEKQTCTVRVGRGGGISITDALVKAIAAPTFYTRKSDGSMSKIEIEYMKFKCRQVSG